MPPRQFLEENIFRAIRDFYLRQSGPKTRSGDQALPQQQRMIQPIRTDGEFRFTDSTVEMTRDDVILLNLNQWRLFDSTPSMCVGAASVEPAPRRRIDGTGNLAADHVPPPMTRVRNGNSCYERLSIRVQGSIDEQLGRGRLHDLPQIHDSNPVTDMLGQG